MARILLGAYLMARSAGMWRHPQTRAVLNQLAGDNVFRYGGT
jgi:hypothetical protein